MRNDPPPENPAGPGASTVVRSRSRAAAWGLWAVALTNDADRIISRSMAYGILIALLAAVYAAAVLVLEPLHRPLTGESTLAIAASTLLAVAVSRPRR